MATQATPAPTSAPEKAPPAPAAPPAALPPPTPKDTIQFDARGRLVGIDGVLDQIGDALGKQALKLMPLVSADKELQRTVGKAAGKAAAREVSPILWVIAGTLVAITVIQWRNMRRLERARMNPVESYDEEHLGLPPPPKPKPLPRPSKRTRR